MNTKRLLPMMLLAMALVMFWSVGVNYVYKQMGWQLPGEQKAQETSSTTAPTTTATTQPGSVASTRPSSQANEVVSSIRPVATTQTSKAILGSEREKDSNYALAVHTTSRGAGIDSVTLNQFRQTVNKPDPYSYQHPYDNSSSTAPLATRTVVVNGATIALADVDWNLESSSTDSSTYTLDLTDSTGHAVVRARKTYLVRTRQETKGKSDGYEVGVSLGFENLTDQPVTVSSTFNGTNIPPVEVYRGLDRQIVGGYEGGGQLIVEPHAVEEFKKENTTRDMTRSTKNDLPLMWAGTVGVYFDAIVRPLPLEPGKLTPQYIKQVEAQSANSDHPEKHDVTTTFTTADQTLAAKQSIEYRAEVFFGPKQRALLNNDYYKSPAIAYSQTLVLGGSCAWCTFQWLVDFLVMMLVGLHWLFGGFAGHGDWGLAIIALVCIVRLILHPITKKSQVNMMRMGKMGPEIERLKKKFGDDKEGLSKAQMDLYKNIGFTPVWGCLPMFLQMPIFIALFAALNSTFELRHASFLWGLTWIKDLSQPDRMIYFPNHPISLGFFAVDSINLLPILVAVVSFFSTKYTPKPPATTPEQEQQQKMMQWMTLFLPLIFYNMPSGLNIYYLTSTSIGIIEGKRIRDHIKEREEAEKAGKVIIDAAPSRRRKPTETEPEKPKTGLGAWIARKMQEIEEMKQEQSKRANRR